MIRSKEIAEALYTLNERSIKYIHLTTLQDALLLYQQQAVITMEVEHHQIKATVRDNQVFSTSLNFNLLGNSHCSCTNKEICVHLVAVYFAAYAFQGFRPEIIVKKALEQPEKKRAEPNHTQPAKALAPAPKPQENNKAAGTKTIAVTPPAKEIIQSDDNIAIWHSYFHAKFKQFPSSSGFVDFSTIVSSNTKALASLSQNWPANKQRLFQMHFYLFQLQKLEESYLTSNNRSTYYYSHGINEAIQDCYERLYQSLMNISKTPPTKLDQQHLEQTSTLLSIITFPEKKSPIDWSYFYCLIWNMILGNSGLFEIEKTRLLNYVEQKDLTSYQKQNGFLALAYFWFIVGNDANTTKNMEQSGAKITLELSLSFINSLLQPNQTTRLLFWLNWLKPHMNNALTHELEKYLEIWARLVPIQLTEEAYLQTIADFLPKSSSQYTTRLIDQENYATLLDYMLSMQIPLSHLPTGMIRKIESKEAQLLLPHYHQAVEIAITYKNRDAYKQAVKAMKKLQLLYKKLKQIEQWERYLAWIRSHYSRLSALHEEMAKGLK